MSMHISDLIEDNTGMNFRRVTAGGEYAGPCPFCRGGEDRFRIWPQRGRYWCRQCDAKGDSIQFVMDYKHLTFVEACAFLQRACPDLVGNIQRDTAHQQIRSGPKPAIQAPPGAQWTGQVQPLMAKWQAALMQPNSLARAWLNNRGLKDETLRAFDIGYNPADWWAKREDWGLQPEMRTNGTPKGLWLPRGITIPWRVDGQIWGISIRRPQGEPKYYWVPGGTRALFNVDSLQANRGAVIVEGEFDAISLWQEAGGVAAVVATGGTKGAQVIRWIARLNLCNPVLVAFDRDLPGKSAADFWLRILSHARRWHPYWGDINGMLQGNMDLRKWIHIGLNAA